MMLRSFGKSSYANDSNHNSYADLLTNLNMHHVAEREGALE